MAESRRGDVRRADELEADAMTTGDLAAASAGSDAEGTATLKKNEVGLLGSTVFALAGSAPGQTVSIVLATLVATAAYATILPLAISALGLPPSRR
jgi:hypothetical protein